MSVKAMTAVWEDSQAVGNDLILLLAIADCANDEGTNAFPSQETLALKARMSVRTVQRSVAALKESGELLIERESTYKGTNNYTVVVAWKRFVSGLNRDRRQVDVCVDEDTRKPADSGANSRVPDGQSSTHVKLTGVTRHDSGDGMTRQVDGGKADTADRSDVSHPPSSGGPDPSFNRSLSARARHDKLTGDRGGTLIARGEGVNWQRDMERHHAKCHPEICNWRNSSVPQCMPLALVDEYARKLPGMSQADALTYVISFAANDRPPKGYVLPGTIYKHWADRWDAAHPSQPTAHAQGPRVPGASETDRLLDEMTAGRDQ